MGRLGAEERMSEKEKMLRGELYFAEDVELAAERVATEVLQRRYNETGDVVVLKTLLGRLGQGAVMRAPFYCDYGYNIFLEDKVFLNFGCVLLDVCRIEIGYGTQIGPAVQIYSADHPRDPEVRKRGLENGKPVKIGRNVWIGGGSILLPGITVGDDAVIGAGSVVTRDVAAGSTVMGNPARVKGSGVKA
ncbi:MAG: maltose acetyltransferase [Acidobacteriaceae bacterium]|nr:maltose acetyltransferase [Acidobacteriaceae bacterium]